MQRIAVIGNGGGGKSHLCRALGRALHVPVFTVDSIQWQPGWRPAPRDEVRRVHAAWLQSDAWIIDGWGDWPLIEERFRQADAIIFVDFPLWRHFWWATKRMIKSCFHRLPEEPAGCSYARVPWRMYQTLWRVHHHLRPRLKALLAEQAPDRLIHIYAQRLSGGFQHRATARTTTRKRIIVAHEHPSPDKCAAGRARGRHVAYCLRPGHAGATLHHE